MFTRRFMPPEYLLDPVLLPVDQADQLEHLVDPLVQRRAAQAVHAAPEQQVLPAAQVVVEGDVLRDDADERLDLLRLRG